MAGVFISYARSDDEPFVERLHRDLVERGIDVWWDRQAMESRGLTFLQEIRDAIEDADRVLAVIGPRAVRSAYCRAEWDHARRFAKGVVPVLRIGEFELVPGNLDDAFRTKSAYARADPELSALHCPDFRPQRPYEEALEELMRILAVAPAPLGALLTNVPALPPHFLPRDSDLDHLSQTVLADVTRPVVITSAEQTVALLGMGGVGKSVLAAAFARAVLTRRACVDGVVWLTLGQNPDLLGTIRGIGTALGDEALAYEELRQAKARLVRALAGRRCLIVLDDVWRLSDAAAVRDALDPGGRLLITSRDGGLVDALGARRIGVDVLSDDGAMKLLSDWSDRPRERLPDEAREVVRECGRLPLAVAMIGAMLRGRPGRWDNVLHKLRNADLKKIRQEFPNYPYTDLLRSIQVSVEALGDDERERYEDLAVFPEDARIPEAALQTLWDGLGLDAYDVEDLADTFVSRSLAHREAGDRLALHDLQHDYLRKTCADLPALHGRLLEAYAASCPNGWPGGPDDGYFFEHLGWHLVEAGRVDELVDLLTTSPAWASAKFGALCTNQPTFADFELAVEPTREVAAMARLVAARAVVRQHAEAYDDEMIRALVRLGRTKEAMAHGRTAAETVDRYRLLAAVREAQTQIGRVDAALDEELLRVVRTIPGNQDRCLSLCALVERLGDDERVPDLLGQAEVAARNADSAKTRAELLGKVAAAYRRAGLPEAEALADDACALAETWVDDRIAGLSAAAVAALAQAGRYDVAERLGQAHDVRFPNSSALSDASRAATRAGDLDVARRLAGLVDDSVKRGEALHELAVALARSDRIDEGLALAETTDDAFWLARTLAAIAPFIDAHERRRGVLDRAWRHAGARGAPARRLEALADVAVASSSTRGSLADSAFAAMRDVIEEHFASGARGSSSESARLSRALCRAGRIRDALAAARAVGKPRDRGWALSGIAEALAKRGDPRASAVLDEAVAAYAAAGSTMNEEGQLETCVTALAGAGEAVLAWRISQLITTPRFRCPALCRVLRHLSPGARELREEVRVAALETARATGFLEEPGEKLLAVATALAQSDDSEAGRAFAEAERAARESRRPYAPCFPLCDVALAMAGAGVAKAETVFDEAYRVAREVKKPLDRAYSLGHVAGMMARASHPRTADVLAEAETALADLPESDQPGNLQRCLVELLVQANRLDDARRVCRAIRKAGWRDSSQCSLVEGLAAAGRFDEALEDARIIEDVFVRGEALTRLGVSMARQRVPWVSGVLDEALESIRSGAPEARQSEKLLDVLLPLAMTGDERLEAIRDEAVRKGEGEYGDFWREVGDRYVADALAEAGRCCAALRYLFRRNVDEIIAIVAEWGPFLERERQGLSVEVLRDAVRIAAWVRPNWVPVARILDAK